VAVSDATGGELREAVETALRGAQVDGRPRFDVRPGHESASEAELKRAVIESRLDGYVHLPADAVATASASYYGRNVANRIDLRALERQLNGVLVSRRLAGAGLDPANVKDLTRELDMKTIRLSEKGEREDQGGATILALILMMILYTGLLMWGQAVMTSVIEEKTSRVVEVMAAGVPTTTLLLGKLLGVGAAGLTQFLVWAVSFFGVSLAAAGPLGTFLPFKAPEVTPLMVGSFVAFFVLGFLFYAALFAAIGASVNTVQEAQGLAFPVMLPIILSVVSFPLVLESPDGARSVVLSMIPGMSPLVMFLRIVVLTPPLWQVLLSITLLALGILAVVWMAARIYRVGILMYGKRPTFPEIMRWVRHS
jgi:ABC-2 type transport system permease protein